MKKLFLSMILLALPLLVSAYDCQVDGIYYNLRSGNLAEVTYESASYNSYSGEVVIPEEFTFNGVKYSVTGIGKRAFSDCTDLTFVTISNSVTYIGNYSFENCINLSSVIIPNSVTSIGSAFYNCTGLTSVTIPNSITSIEDGAFYNCTSLTAVHITDLEAWGKITFKYITSNPLYYAHHLYINGEEQRRIVISNSVTSVGNYVFCGCNEIVSVTIPESVTSIGRNAFYGCSGLTSINIPNSVTSIGDWAFYGCSGLTSVKISNSVTNIGEQTFSGCSSLSSVTIPNSVTSIEKYAFYGCSGLTSMTIPNSVTSIGGFAFQKCSGLVYVTIPNSITSIGEWAFNDCSGLISVYITDLAAWCNIDFSNYDSNPLCYAHHLYIGNTEVSDIEVPESVLAIKQNAFYHCISLTSVTIPNSVTSIGDYAFSNCGCLTTVIIPNSVTSIGDYAFSNCSGLTSVTIPNSVISIGESAFRYCYGLKTLTLPEDLSIIKKSTFQNCRNLTEVVISAKVEFIYADAFSECGLKSVTSLAVNPPFCHDLAFSNYNIPLYVPDEAVNSYQTTNPWSKFSELKTISGDPIDNKCATPTISYANKELTFSCETEGVEFVSKITDADIKDFYSDKISLTTTYNISVYVTKSGYTNSDVATATLVWTNAIFTETTETPTSAKAVQESIPVLISAKGGNISVRCETEGQEVNVYTIDGLSLGTATVKNGEALISTSIPSGDIAVVKVGGRSVKVIMR